MIIFGTQKTILDTCEIPTAKCTHCSSTKTIIFRTYQKYGHLFWIPMFPIEKIAITVCTHCKQALTDEQIPKEYWDAISIISHNSKTPKWTFMGLFLFVLFVLFMIISGIIGNSMTKNRILNPKIGDVYSYRTDDLKYILLKVQSVEKDSIFFFVSRFASNKRQGLTELMSRGDSIYNNSGAIGYSKKNLIDWNSTARLLEVGRKE